MMNNTMSLACALVDMIRRDDKAGNVSELKKAIDWVNKSTQDLRSAPLGLLVCACDEDRELHTQLANEVFQSHKALKSEIIKTLRELIEWTEDYSPYQY